MPSPRHNIYEGITPFITYRHSKTGKRNPLEHAVIPVVRAGNQPCDTLPRRKIPYKDLLPSGAGRTALKNKKGAIR